MICIILAQIRSSKIIALNISGESYGSGLEPCLTEATSERHYIGQEINAALTRCVRGSGVFLLALRRVVKSALGMLTRKLSIGR